MFYFLQLHYFHPSLYKEQQVEQQQSQKHKKGKVGYAIGKHIEIPEAIKKAVRLAKKNMYSINVVGEQDTIPHEIIGHHGAARVMLKPAAEGKGVIASDTVRAVVELGGVRNIYSKNLGSNNPHNVVHATVKALSTTRTKEQINSLRTKSQGRTEQLKSAPKPETTKTEVKKPVVKKSEEKQTEVKKPVTKKPETKKI